MCWSFYSKRGTRGCVPITGASHYSKVLERRVGPIVEPRIEEELCGFTFSRILEGAFGICPTSLHVYCRSGKGVRLGPPGWTSESPLGVWREGNPAQGNLIAVRPE